MLKGLGACEISVFNLIMEYNTDVMGGFTHAIEMIQIFFFLL